MIIFGEGIELFVEPVPDFLVDRTLVSSEIGKKSGLNVIGIRKELVFDANPGPSTVLVAGAELVMLGTIEQRSRFHDLEPKG